MKNLDIEKLERKNIYTAPDNFFEQMQQNVLQNTVLKDSKAEEKQGKIVKMNWWYAAAAAIALLFGTTFYLNQSDEDSAPQIAQNKIEEKTVTQNAKTEAAEAKPSVSEQNYQTLVADLTSEEIVNQTETKPITTTKKTSIAEASPKPEAATKTKPEQQVEQILQGLSEEEIAALAKHTDQDIYLDLYN